MYCHIRFTQFFLYQCFSATIRFLFLVFCCQETRDFFSLEISTLNHNTQDFRLPTLIHPTFSSAILAFTHSHPRLTDLNVNRTYDSRLTTPDFGLKTTDFNPPHIQLCNLSFTHYLPRLTDLNVNRTYD